MNKNIQEVFLCLNKKDHRDICKEQDLFSFHEEGPGFAFYRPKGLMIKHALLKLWRKEHLRAKYEEIESPMMLSKKLWEQSGHWDLYKENMYISKVDKHDFAIKPMNCPGAMLYYKEKKRSFKELPLRVCELGRVHRNENSGSLHGLLRVRSFIVDDAHIFCEKERLGQEVRSILLLIQKILKKCGFEQLEFELSVRSEKKKDKYLGDDQSWEVAEDSLESSLKELGLDFKRMEGEAKFYGPAIDVKIKDSQGRSWQCSSIQMDFNLAKRFNLYYFDQNGKKQIPFILHRCIFGSLERFIGMLLEHYQGKLPFWLAPIQLYVMSVDKSVNDYAQGIIDWLEDLGFRVDGDLRDESLSSMLKKVRLQQIPMKIIIGPKEKEEQKISIKMLSGEQVSLVKKDKLLELINFNKS